MSTTDTRDEVAFTQLADGRRRLADLLEQLSPAQWEHDSLCSAWQVRDVATHVAVTPQPVSAATLARGVLHARGDIWAFLRDYIVQLRDTNPRDAVVSLLRDHAEDRTIPPLTHVHNLVLDITVHTEDIARPLGIPTHPPGAQTVAALHRAWEHAWPFKARKRLRGIELVATDADVRLGSGRAVEGRAIDLLLLATGRDAAALPHLAGPGVALLGK